ncbi:MAG TPA: hypothetical protein VM639_01720 [Dongiaceae bacterium]|nr:hypothetical protein [Dongiaceae bacterium]
MLKERLRLGNAPAALSHALSTVGGTILCLSPRGCDGDQAVTDLHSLGFESIGVHDVGEAIGILKARREVRALCVDVCANNDRGVISADMAKSIREDITIVYIVSRSSDLCRIIGVRHGPVLERAARQQTSRPLAIRNKAYPDRGLRAAEGDAHVLW